MDKNKVFLINRGLIDVRLDPFYYKPEFLELEKKVSKKSVYKLRHYIHYLASGATPHKADAEKYYSDEINGIPFLRVQNVTPSSEVQLQDVKYINLETHKGMLQRSQIKAGDLLVKITGVGRMAVASVVPENFEGNINQHLVVITTDNRETSEILAAFLNSDIGEKLAKRRSTGGTRPALDYPALRSIPIVFDKRILEIQREANKKKKQKLAEAQALLDSIDDYLLTELGIKRPKAVANSLENRIFTRNFSELSGGRFDAFYYQDEFEKLEDCFKSTSFDVQKLGNLISHISYGASVNNNYVEQGIPLLRIKDLKRNEISVSEIVYLPELMRKEIGNCFVKEGDFLISRSGSLGIIARVEKEIEGFAFGSFMIKFTLKKKANVNPIFLSFFLNSSLTIKEVERNKIGAIQGNITIPTIKSLKIILPPIEKQTEIASHIQTLRDKAKHLQQQAETELQQAKQQVEKMILGEN